MTKEYKNILDFDETECTINKINYYLYTFKL